MTTIEKIKEFYNFLQNIYINVSDEVLPELYNEQKIIILNKIQEIDNEIKNDN